MAENEQTDVTALTVQLLSAYLANNSVAHTDLAELVRATKAALIEDAAPAEPQPEATTYTPAVSARRSLASADHILSMIDGKPYRTLKRHLTSHGLTPDSYRQRYSLPASYPMVAPGFAAERRAIAEKIGLGRRPAGTAPASEKSPARENAVAASASPATAANPATEPVKGKTPANTSQPKKASAAAAEPAVAAERFPAEKATRTPAKSLAKTPAKKASAAKSKRKVDAPTQTVASTASETKMASATAPVTPDTEAKPETTATDNGAPVAAKAKAAPRRDTLKLFKEAAANLPPRTSKPNTAGKAAAAKAQAAPKAARKSAKKREAANMLAPSSDTTGN